MRRAWQVVRLALRLLPVVLVLAIVVPGSGVRPTTLSLAKIEKAQGYDAGNDVVWVLVLGSDAPPNQPPTSGDTDAFQLLAIDARTGAAAGIGIPRDSYVDLHGDLGPSRINIALKEGMERGQGFGVVVRAVEELVGITPDFVLVTAGDGFTDMFDALGGRVEVTSTVAFTTPDGLVVEKGVNDFTAAEALEFAEFRDFPGQGDLTRSANHQALLLGLLKELQRQDDRHGFVETMAFAALDGIATEDVSPLDLYRLLNLLTSVDPALVEGCIVTGKDIEDEAGNMVIDPDEELAQRLGREAADDATFENGCSCADPRRPSAQGSGGPGFSMPASRARTMAWARWATCSLAKMLLAWLRTVFTDRVRSRAISALSRPSAILPRISRSRSVRSGKAWADGRLRTWRKYVITRSAMPGPKITSPAPTASIARRISWRRAPLRR